MVVVPRNRLLELRRDAGLTQKQLAATVGVHESTVSRWETTGRISDDDCKTALAEVFGVSVLFLMGWDAKNGGDGDGQSSKRRVA